MIDQRRSYPEAMSSYGMLASWYENVASDNRSPANPRNLGRSPTLIQD
jgi:hypothetical protein